jgi:putative ABC transport system permease protein
MVYLLSGVPSVSGLIDADMSLLKYPGLLGFTAIMAVFLGVLSGVYPAVYSTSFQPALVLKGSFGLTPQGRMLRNALIGVQFVASMVLIIAASFMYLQNRYLFTMPLGYDRDAIIISDLNENTNNRRNVLINELKAFSGIEDIAFAESLIGSVDQHMAWGRNYMDKQISFQCLPVSENYLDIMNISVSEGRNFREDDKETKRGKYIFNETARRQYEMQLNTDINGSEIIGFIPDVHFSTFHTSISPMAFYIWGTENWGNRMSVACIKVKAGSNMFEAMNHVKKVFAGIDPEYPFNVRFYDDVLETTYQKDQRMTSQITVFGIISLFMSLRGVFGLILFETRFRRREIAIRKVHGSSVEEVVGLFGKTYFFIWALCFVIACPLAYFFAGKWLDGFAYKTPLHAWVFAAGGAIVLCVTLATVSWQSYRAATQNPTRALSGE